MMKHKIEKNTVQETLIIPLYARKVCSELYPSLYRDETAIRLIDSIDYDFSEAEKNAHSLMQRFGSLEVAMRQNDLAFEVRDYLKAHPGAAVVNLGCGLDSTGRNCDNGSCKIYNLDFPDVIAVRNELLPAGEREENISCDLNDTAWLGKIDASSGAVFFASGVFYYFLTEQVKALVQRMADAFPGGVLVFDAANQTAVKIEPGKPVLKDVSFTAKQGQVTALVGPSGGGKSTIANLAAGFYPVDGGRITLGGTDIAPIDSTALMKDFSVVFQNVVLFNNTVMENIRVGRKDATDAEVMAAAKAAHCHEFIEKLPIGYQTVIGENGSTLSGGECQRLSIARALLKDAPVILLDEATASLDVDNETEIQEAITHLVRGKTVLIIAHRMRTVENADKIVVLDGGVVAESGTHEEMMRKNGLYRRLVELQTAAANWKIRA